ncbi:MAG: metalloprotease PmbA [Gammaproteobacteria bacterium]|nr:metalloprotease PmbA [Gammaproteobacteria bacterium]
MTRIAEFQLSEDELKGIVSFALAEAQRLGASAAEATATLDSGLDLTVRMGDVETLQRSRDRGLGITVYFGQSKGSASTADLDRTAVAESVAAACTIAKFTAADQYAGLADPALLATDFPDLDMWHPWELQVEEAIELARNCEDAARAVDPRIENSDGATVSSFAGMRVYGNTNDFLAAQRGTQHSISCAVLGKQGDEMQRDYWYSAARRADLLEAAGDVGRRAGERTVQRLGSRRLGTRKCPVLFAPEIAKSLYGHFLGAIRGTSQYREASFLLGAAGEQVFPEWLSIEERPRLPGGPGSSAFDDEGVATQDRHLVEAGELKSYILGSYSARRLGLQTTGNAGGVRNVRVTAGGESPDAPLKALCTGLLVTELMGQGVNGVTGDYSRGAAGFWIENGEVQFPVEEITIAGNLRRMYENIVTVGDDVDQRGNLQVGSTLIAEMTIAGE